MIGSTVYLLSEDSADMWRMQEFTVTRRLDQTSIIIVGSEHEHIAHEHPDGGWYVGPASMDIRVFPSKHAAFTHRRRWLESVRAKFQDDIAACDRQLNRLAAYQRIQASKETTS